MLSLSFNANHKCQTQNLDFLTVVTVELVPVNAFPGKKDVLALSPQGCVVS